MIVSPSVRLASDVCLSATPLKITRKRRNVCKSILNLSIYVSCIWSMCAPAWCVPHRPDKCTKLKILLLNGSLAEKRSSPKWWMMPWHSLALTHTHKLTLSLTHTRLHDTPIDRQMNEMAEWHFVLPCERSIKIFPGGGLPDSSNRFRLPASSLKARFKDFSLSRRWYVASLTTVWQYPLLLGSDEGASCKSWT